MSDKSTARLVGEHVVALFAPLREAASDLDAFRALFARLGWDVTVLPQEYVNLADHVADAIDAVQALSEDVGFSDIEPVFQVVSGVYKDLTTLTPPTGVGASAAELAETLVELLLADHLAKELPGIWNLLRHLGLVASEYHPATTNPDRPAFVQRKLLWRDLPDVLSDPTSIPNRVYRWGDDDFDFAKLATDLFSALVAFGVRAELRGNGLDLATQPFVDDPTQAEHPPDIALDIVLLDGTIADQPVEVGLTILPAPREGTHKRGLAVQPLVPDDLSATIDISDSLKLVLTGAADLASAFGVVARPDEDPVVKQPFESGATPLTGTASVALEKTFTPPAVLLGRASSSRLDLQGLRTAIEFLASTAGTFEARFELGVKDVSIVLSGGDGDGFIGAILGNGEKKATFSFGLRWSTLTGLSFSAAGGFSFSQAVDFSIGPIHISKVDLAISGKHRESGAGAVAVAAGVALDATLGPVTATVDGIGLHVDVAFEPGNAGPLDIGAGFKPPNGVGIAVNGGAISGGGFLSFDFDAGRYSGAIELEAYSISIKAFGLIETKVPGGGFSFVIVISTEFATPIQLGLGFTLNGVGGMIGINRTVDGDALRALVVAGRTENLLFPKNVIANAPAIIRDLATVFPARQGHYVFGPLAKLGWGTPTLITAELALILELPGPVLSLIGEVKCLLPKPDLALVKFNMSIAGQLDFPNKSFSLDASLHDSVIEGYPVSGQMAMRLRWGEQPNFALSIGGFHPAYQPPPNFPKLQPMTLSLAQQGSTSVTISGFFALTSNSLQIGGDARLHAGGSGISLDASISVKTIFIFSPFSFAANIDASVKISFHGHGPSVHLSGVLSGPSPWRAKGEVCVSILWWDACLRFDQTFGGATTVPEPELDPWLGSSTVQGLQAALQDPKNWAALPPPGSFTVVSRAPGANDLVDPLGGFTVRQKAVPVETTLAIARFGPAKAAEPATNRTGPIFFNGASGTYGANLALTRLDTLKDFFAPAQFFDMNETKKLSAKSFDKYGSGYSFAIKPANLEAGSSVPKPLQYTTLVLGSGGTVTQPNLYDLPPAHLAAKSTTSAVARGGFAQSGTRRYVDPAFTHPFDINDTAFTLAFTSNLQAVTPGDTPLPRADALVALDAYLALHPEKRGQIQVVPLHELAAA